MPCDDYCAARNLRRMDARPPTILCARSHWSRFYCTYRQFPSPRNVSGFLYDKVSNVVEKNGVY